ncbi:hypothetical protein [Marinifilum fragile]|uniref:hypothetical protein n=1 Tax=Marinifilum fragile TaxID=570161 RepID=UPI0006CF262C|nr:hypothetical protein [Marinifilum fragile]
MTNRFDEHSKRIGETVRYISYSVIAADFGILTAKIEYFKDYIDSIRFLIVFSLILSITGFLFDYFNALAGFLNEVYKSKKKLKPTRKGCIVLYHLGYLFFYLKQVFVLLAFIFLIVAIAKVLK